MNKINNAAWFSTPKFRKNEASDMDLQQMIDLLDERATPETAAVFGEIKGLYSAYKLAPSAVLLEAIVVKCLSIILSNHTASQSFGASTPVKTSRTHPDSMDWEWVQGFAHFLLLSGISENTRQVYIRALKRVIKNNQIYDVKVLIDNIDFYINQYDGNDQAAHNVHLAALRQFRSFIFDECGYFVSVMINGNEEIVSRVYCTLDLARQEFEEIEREYRGVAESVKLYDKFASLVEEITIR